MCHSRSGRARRGSGRARSAPPGCSCPPPPAPAAPPWRPPAARSSWRRRRRGAGPHRAGRGRNRAGRGRKRAGRGRKCVARSGSARRGGARGPHGGGPAGAAGLSGGPMGKYCASLGVLKGPWDQVFAAFWQRYPNPYRCARARPGPTRDRCRPPSSAQRCPRGSRGLRPSGMGVPHRPYPAGIGSSPAFIPIISS